MVANSSRVENSLATWRNGMEPSGVSLAVERTTLSMSLGSYEGDLVAGGHFSYIGGTNCRKIGRWNGASWSQLGNGMNGGVFALTQIGTYLLVGASSTPPAVNRPTTSLAGTDRHGVASHHEGSRDPAVHCIQSRISRIWRGFYIRRRQFRPTRRPIKWRGIHDARRRDELDVTSLASMDRTSTRAVRSPPQAEVPPCRSRSGPARPGQRSAVG